MELFTRKMMVSRVIERFKRQYSRMDVFAPDFQIIPINEPPTTAGAIVKQLEAFGDTITFEQAESVLPGWSTLQCDECKRQVDSVIRVGDDPDYESNTAYLCRDCITKALDLADEAIANDY